MKKILIMGAEAVPFASTGGLGDVMGSLPQAIKKIYGDDGDIRVVLPLYSKVPESYRAKMKLLREFYVTLAWRQQYCGLFEYHDNGVTYYFLDNEYYFKRDTLYGQYDDAERYAFFCRAALDIMSVLDFYPDVLHANDWQCALAVIYLKKKYSGDENYARIKTVYTIHNIDYQGVFSHDILGDVLDLDPALHDLVDYNGAVNLMKGAVICCDKLTTVSARYAQEIQDEYFSGALAPIIRENSYKTTGIVNGIDTDYYNPKKDKEIKFKYSRTNRSGKAENKLELQRMFGLPEDPEVPVIAMVSRLASHKGFDLVARVLEDILQWQVQFVILGTGEKKYEDYFTDISRRYPSKTGVVLAFNKALSKQIYAGADIFLMPSKSEPCGLSQMIAAAYGTIPVVHEVGGLGDTIVPFDVTSGTGNGLNFRSYNAHDMMDAVRRAVELYYDDKKMWNILVTNAMKSDFTWDASARGYTEIYNNL